MKYDYDIDFINLIPRPSIEEYNLLRKNILREGCRDPLIIWTETLSNGEPGRTILLDGYTRYEICKKNRIQFTTREIKLKDRNEAKIWVIQNQLGRRNLTSYQRGKLTLELKSMIQEKAKEKQRESGGAVRQKSDKPVVDTKKELAKIAGVSHDTIHKVEVIENEAPPEVKEAAEKGKISINKAYQKTRESKEWVVPKNKKMPPPSLGMQFARMAIRDLEQITDDDTEREQAFTYVEKWVNNITFPCYLKRREREAEEAERIEKEISTLLEKDEQDLTEEEKTRVDSYLKEVSPYHLHKEKFENCENAWRNLSKKQKEEFAKRYLERR